MLELDIDTKEEMGPRRIATFIESFWWDTEPNRWPTLQEISEFSGWTTDQLAAIKDPVNAQLRARGCPPVDFKTAKEISAAKKHQRRPAEVDVKFAAACALVCDTLDKRSIAAKLKTIPMSTREWQRLLADPTNNAYFRKRISKEFKEAETLAQMSLIKNIENGDLQSIKHFHEVTGVYRPNQETLLNLGVLIGQLMEILASHVDRDTLGVIAEKFQAVMEGKSVQSQLQAIEISATESDKVKLLDNPLIPSL